MKILIIGGTFDNEYKFQRLLEYGTTIEKKGKESKLVYDIYKEIKKLEPETDLINGGDYAILETIMTLADGYDVIFWWANIPDNNLPKIRNIKELYPKALLVSSKRNDNKKYSFAELINRALELKANLTIEFAKNDDIFKMRVFDPLGNIWSDTTSIETTCEMLHKRLVKLMSYTRQNTIRGLCPSDIPNQPEFFDYIKECAEIFHEYIKPDASVTRFLGNSSYRCQRGFPSFRDENYADTIYVSQRNIDKRFIEKDNFVPVKMHDNKIFYGGDKKPSVDTPIQLRLYQVLPNINYMIHSHCYAETEYNTSLNFLSDEEKMVDFKILTKDEFLASYSYLTEEEYDITANDYYAKNNTFSTNTAIPCGCLEEVDEILNAIPYKNTQAIAVNLKGHGCIIMGNTIADLQKFKFARRITPEYII